MDSLKTSCAQRHARSSLVGSLPVSQVKKRVRLEGSELEEYMRKEKELAAARHKAERDT